MSQWQSFDKVSHRSLIIAAYQANKITGARAWQEFTERDLWGDREEAFFHYVNGLHAFEAARDVMTAPSFVKRAVKQFLFSLYGRSIIKLETAQWAFTLFGVEAE